MLRLDRALSDMGIGTRRELRSLIRGGRVKVDGRVLLDPAAKIDELCCSISVDGEPRVYRRHVYFMLNKPGGFLSATYDPKARTVMELLPENLRESGLFPVGRLDRDTVGLLILTNDGALAHAVTAPGRHVDKVYSAHVRGVLDKGDVAAFSGGIVLEDGSVCRPAELRILEAGEVSRAEVTLREGKFHQIKRMFLSRGKRVIYLSRISVGGVRLDGSLPEGGLRPLTDKEIKLLFEASGPRGKASEKGKTGA